MTRQIYGYHAIAEALSAKSTFLKVYVLRENPSDRLRQLIGELKKSNVQIQYVPPEKLNKLAGKAHQGIVALVSDFEFQSLSALIPFYQSMDMEPFLVMLDGVTDVRNMGAITRSAECFGVHSVVVPAVGSALLNEEAVKASAGAIGRINICRENDLFTSINFLKGLGFQIIACTEKAKTTFSEISYTGSICIILGSEGFGIDSKLLALADHSIYIPMQGSIASLNVSVAAGIILQHASASRA